MNTRLLRKVAKHIAEEPKRFQMGNWYQSNEVRTVVNEFATTAPATHPFPKCGTAACIGGWACILSGITDRDVLEDAGQAAAHFLAINDEKADRLFAVRSWPNAFRKKYRSAKKVTTRVRIAVARIEHFIKTKGAE